MWLTDQFLEQWLENFSIQTAPQRVSQPHDEIKTTPKNESILSGIIQLASISDGTALEIVSKLRRAEIAMYEAGERYEQALRDIADTISEEGTGWSFDEIWKTILRGITGIIRHLRSKGLDV